MRICARSRPSPRCSPLPSRPASARAADWVGLGDSFAAGPLIPNQSLSRSAACARAATTRTRRRQPRDDARRRLLQRREDDEHDRARRARARARTRRSSTRSPPRHAGRLAADRRQRHRLHRDPPELRDRQPVRRGRARTATTPAATTRSSRIDATAPKVAAVIEGIHTRAPARADPGRQLRGDPARRAAAAAGRRCRSPTPTCRTCAAKQQALNTMLAQQAAAQRRDATSTPTRRASARTRASPRARAGSSRSCRATPPRRSIPTPAVRRASRSSVTAASVALTRSDPFIFAGWPTSTPRRCP